MIVRMPFGRYRGRSLEEVPEDYLLWLRSIDLSDWLRDAVEDEMALRGAGRFQEQPCRPPAADWSGVIARWYRQLALDFHPDRGGSHEAMKVVNEAYNRLRKLLAA
jgi:hypothetical protein